MNPAPPYDRRMALIRNFTRLTGNTGRIRSEVDCGYKIVDIDGHGRVVDLSTYGSDARKLDGKASQSIQLDKARARELFTILQEAFPGIEDSYS